MDQFCYFLWTSHNNKLSASPDPHQGLCLWTPLGAPPQTPVIGSITLPRSPCSSPSRNEILRTPLYYYRPRGDLTHYWVDARHGVRQHLHLKVLHDEVVSSVLQQLLFEVLRRVQILARRITPLALALCIHTYTSSFIITVIRLSKHSTPI